MKANTQEAEIEVVEVEVIQPEGSENTELVEVDEVLVEDIPEQLNIKELETEFTLFIKEAEAANSNIASNIQMDEINEISDEVIKAKQYITSFANGEKRTVREQAYTQLVSLPLIGGWAKDKVEEVQVQQMKDSGVKEVLEGIFSSFETKKTRLIELTEMAEGMRNNLMIQEKQLTKYIVQLDRIIENPPSVADKMRAVDMSNTAMAQSSISKEMIYSQLAFIIELMENLMMKISKTLPTLKNTLNNSLQITGVINSMRDAVEMMNTLEDLSNEITRSSTNNIQNLIVEVTESMTSGMDMEFYEGSAKRNMEHHEKLGIARKKYIQTTLDNNDKLRNIELDHSRLLDTRRKEEAKLLGVKIEDMKDDAQEALAEGAK